jgi:DNA-binding CsgD family transcriptional regulator
MIAFAALRTRTMSVIRDFDPQDEGAASAPASIAAAVTEALSWLEYGLLLVDGGSLVHFASGKARRQLQSGHLSIQAGQLRTRTLGETLNLHRLVARCAHIGQVDGDEAATCRVGELLLQLAPLAARPPDSARTEGALVAVFVIDPARAVDPSAEQLRQQFGLTPAEAGITCEVVKGNGLMECAGKIGISQATARTHLHRVFEKTGTKRQAELVRKVLAARPVVRRPE